MTMTPQQFLKTISDEYRTLHTSYENHFWKSYMGDHSEDEQMTLAQKVVDDFRTSSEYADQIDEFLAQESDKAMKKRLEGRAYFFSLSQVPEEMKILKSEIDAYETALQARRSKSQQDDTGYTDPETGEFVQASTSKMRMMIRTENDEALRRACREGQQVSAALWVDDLIRLVRKRNEYARGCGYENFYEYKAVTEERMGSTEIFDLFDSLYEPLAANFARVRELEKTTLEFENLRAPRNLSYMLAGDFTKQIDVHIPLGEMVDRRGKSMTALGVDYQGAKMRLDLLERDGKYNNGFCHQPVVGYMQDGEEEKQKHIGGETNFTCNAIPGQVGSGDVAGNTLFHEGGHAAHFSNMRHQDVIFNTERAPCSTARAETHSMFLDTMYSSIERKMCYADTLDGTTFPRELYESMVHELAPLEGRGMLGMSSVVKLEQVLYTTAENALTPEFVIALTDDISNKFSDFSQPNRYLLDLPHLYARQSAAYYHGYGMATLALYQLRDHLYTRDGYIVDNPSVGPRLTEAWKPGSSQSMSELMHGLIGEGLDSKAYLDVVTKTPEVKIATAHERVEKTLKSRTPVDRVSLNADIELRDGTQLLGSTATDDREGLCEKWKERVG